MVVTPRDWLFRAFPFSGGADVGSLCRPTEDCMSLSKAVESAKSVHSLATNVVTSLALGTASTRFVDLGQILCLKRVIESANILMFELNKKSNSVDIAQKDATFDFVKEAHTLLNRAKDFHKEAVADKKSSEDYLKFKLKIVDHAYDVYKFTMSAYSHEVSLDTAVTHSIFLSRTLWSTALKVTDTLGNDVDRQSVQRIREEAANMHKVALTQQETCDASVMDMALARLVNAFSGNPNLFMSRLFLDHFYQDYAWAEALHSAVLLHVVPESAEKPTPASAALLRGE